MFGLGGAMLKGRKGRREGLSLLSQKERKEWMMALYHEFYDKSHMVREKYSRNHALYIDQALGREGGKESPRTGSPVLYATYKQELADAVEMMPEAIFLARRREDEGRAAHLTTLHRAVLERMDFAQAYIALCEYRARLGVAFSETMVVGGQPVVCAFDPRAILVDPLCEDMQEGRAIFKISCHPPSYYRTYYPEAQREMRLEEEVSGTDGRTITMVTGYYRQRGKNGTSVHQMKIAAGAVLYDSKQDRPEGLCTGDQFPFVGWYYDRIPGTPWGFGAFDYLAPVQRYMDKLDTLILRNMARAARPRLLVNRSSGIDMEALADEEREIVQADRIDETALRWQQSAPLAPYALEMFQMKGDMLRRDSGMSAAYRGELPSTTTSGVAISLLQAAGSKRTNLAQAAINQSFTRMVRQVVLALYASDAPGASYRAQGGYVTAQPEELKKWEYDLQIRLRRMPRYESVYQNQLLLQAMQMGAMSPRAAFALMDLENKEAILAAIADAPPKEEGQDGGKTDAHTIS